MQRRTLFLALAVPFLSSCNWEHYEGVVELRAESSNVRLAIDPDFFWGERPERTEDSVWVNFSFPDLKPVRAPHEVANGVSVLILNISTRQTRAEYLFDSQKLGGRRGDVQRAHKQEVKIERRTVDSANHTFAVDYIFRRTPQNYLVCYELIDGLRPSVSRRYSQSVELQYVIPLNLLSKRQQVDDAVVALVDSFLKPNRMGGEK